MGIYLYQKSNKRTYKTTNKKRGENYYITIQIYIYYIYIIIYQQLSKKNSV